MSYTIEDEILEASIKQAREFEEEALRKFAEDFNIGLSALVEEPASPLDIGFPEPKESEGE